MSEEENVVCELVSSDVGDGLFHTEKESGSFRSTIVFTPPSWWKEKEGNEKRDTDTQDVAVDEDGDADVPRASQTRTDATLTLEHFGSTTLDQVCLQLWRGSLFLADFLLQNPDRIRGRRVLEVGAGTGLPSIVSSLMDAALTVATDLPHGINLLRRNLDRNGALGASTLVLPMDITSANSVSAAFDRFGGALDTILLADLIYDDALTRSVFQFLLSVVEDRPRPICVLITIERRTVFTVEKLRACAPAYDYFKEQLERFMQQPKCKMFRVRELTTSDVQQSFCYQNNPQMNLIEILIT